MKNGFPDGSGIVEGVDLIMLISLLNFENIGATSSIVESSDLSLNKPSSLIIISGWEFLMKKFARSNPLPLISRVTFEGWSPELHDFNQDWL